MSKYGPETSDNPFALIELDVPAPKAPEVKRPPTPEELADWQLKNIRACATLDQLIALGASYNDASTPEGKRYRALPSVCVPVVKAAFASHRDMLRARVCVMAWSAIWGSLSRGIAQRNQPTQPTQPDTSTLEGALTQIATQGARMAALPAARRFTAPRTNQTRAQEAAQTQQTRARLYKGEFLYGVGDGLKIDWSRAHGGGTSRRKLIEALTAIGRTDAIPDPKSNAAQFGDVMGSCNSRGLTSRSATKDSYKKEGRNWPQGMISRYVVGEVDNSANLGSLGEKRLVVDLMSDNTIRFDGDATLAARVRAEFNARMAEELFTAGDLAEWLAKTLRYTHHAVEYGAGYYIPPSQVEAVRALIRAVRPLMGRNIAIGKCTTEDDMIEGVSLGLAAEVDEIRAEYEKETARARRENRTAIGTRMAATLVRKLSEVRERVGGFAAILGDAAVADTRKKANELDAVLRPLMDDTSERFAAMDMN